MHSHGSMCPPLKSSLPVEELSSRFRLVVVQATVPAPVESAASFGRWWLDMRTPHIVLSVRAADFLDVRAGCHRIGDDCISNVVPDDLMLLNRVGWILATTTNEGLRDGTRARTLAERAVQLTQGLDPESLDTLAAAQAETGEFDKSIETMRRALERARIVRTEMVPELGQRLAMYRRGEPFRQ